MSPPKPGLLLVTAHPHASLTPAQFHDWYDNEHGPSRLRMPMIATGFRYKALRHENPGWLAMYDVPNIADLHQQAYIDLRLPQNKTAREQATMQRIELDRRIYELVFTRQAACEMSPVRSGAVIFYVGLVVRAEHEREFNEWYETVHAPLFAQVPGWVRTRRFKTHPALDREHEVEYLSIHELDDTRALGGPELAAAADKTGYEALLEKAVLSQRGPSFWTLAYAFGPAPRDLAPLHDASATPFVSLDRKTRTFPVPEAPAIESYITTGDGVEIAYRLEGSAEPEAPVLVMVNSILVDWGIWDGFLHALRTLHSDKAQKYRFLRYNARGRTQQAGGGGGGDGGVTLDTLTSDLIALLDALHIRSVAVAVGVSLGGATVLNAALKFPQRVPKFVACDTNDVAPQTNPKAWAERIAMAEKQRTATPHGEPIVGSELAEATVQRWFAARRHGLDVPVKRMVEENSLEGFKTVVKALYSYDLRPMMGDAKATGSFVVGDADGVLPGTMREMAQRYRGGDAAVSSFVAIEGAGHLPMVEKPERFAEVIAESL